LKTLASYSTGYTTAVAPAAYSAESTYAIGAATRRFDAGGFGSSTGRYAAYGYLDRPGSQRIIYHPRPLFI